MPRKAMKINPPKRVKIPVRQRYQPGQVRYPEQAEIAKKIKESTKISNMTREIENAVKYRDFEKYNRLAGNPEARDTDLTLTRSLHAINLLKQEFMEAKNEAIEYDPTLNLVKEITEISEEMIELLQEKNDKLLLIKGKLNNDDVSESQKRSLNALERDIERYSVDLEKVKSLLKKLEKHQKLPQDQIERIKKRESEKDKRKGIEDAVQTAFSLGISPEDKEYMTLKEAFDEAENLPDLQKWSSNAKKKYQQSVENLQTKMMGALAYRDAIFTDRAKILNILNGKGKSAEDRDLFRRNLSDLTVSYDKNVYLTDHLIKKMINSPPGSFKDFEAQMSLNHQIDSLSADFDAIEQGFENLYQQAFPRTQINTYSETINSVEQCIQSGSDYITLTKYLVAKFTHLLEDEDDKVPSATKMKKTFTNDGVNYTTGKLITTGKNIEYYDKGGNKSRLTSETTNSLRSVLMAYSQIGVSIIDRLEIEVNNLSNALKKSTKGVKEGLTRTAAVKLNDSLLISGPIIAECIKESKQLMGLYDNIKGKHIKK